MNDAAIKRVADTLRDAQERGAPCAPVRDQLTANDLDAAYAVQQHNTDYWVGAGRGLVGAKIGLTSRSVQRQLAVAQPDFGRLFRDMAVADGSVVAPDAVLQPKVEAEVAFILKKALDTPQPTVADIISATDYVLPALEIVGSRIADWDISIVDTIADNASSGLFVLGNCPRLLTRLDLSLCGMSLRRSGEVAATGAGLACLGHPLNAVLWLAETMRANGSPLQAGDIVLSGALGPMVGAGEGDVFEAEIAGLGTVAVSFDRHANLG